MSYDVAVIGLGRVGLPLAITFADHGLSVLGVDKDAERLATVGAGKMPFKEPDTEAPLARAVESGALRLSELAADAAQADAIVLTLGTPTFSHIEIDMSDIRTVLDTLLPHLREGQLLVLRSTVAPHTTEFVAGYLEKRRGFRIGEDLFVAHVPERIAADRFMAEIGTLPCIVGGVGAGSGDRAAALFARLGAPVVRTTPVQAELAKIWANILRYATFALPNLLMMDCERYGANVFEVIDLINRDYPRGGIAQPGFTAGTCLRKDFAFSEERSNAPGMLLAVSRVHESVPLFLVEGIKRRLGDLRDRKVAVLGLAFKGDTDDERDSLSHKLIRHARARARRRRRPRPGRRHADRVVRGGRRGRRRRRRRHEPLRVLATPDALAAIARHGARRLPGRRSLERVRRGPGLRLRERDRGAARPGHVTVAVGVVGLGYWGPNLARNLAALPGAALTWLCDARPEVRERFGAAFPQAQAHRRARRPARRPGARRRRARHARPDPRDAGRARARGRQALLRREAARPVRRRRRARGGGGPHAPAGS